MSQRFDYEKIDVVEFLRGLGVRNIRDLGLEVSYSCPFEGHSRDDNHPSASMTKTTVLKNDGTEYPPTTFNCFTCGKAGTAVTFLADYEGVSILTARRLLKEKFGMAFREPTDGLLAELTKMLEEQKKFDREILQLEIDKAVMENFVTGFNKFSRAEENNPAHYMRVVRGFRDDTLFNFRIGYDHKSNRITIPVHDDLGRLIGFKGRRWDNNQTGEYNPKYLVLGGANYNFDTYDVSKILFALPHAREYIDSSGTIIVVEGELNAISMHQKGFKNTVGISGQYISPYQRRLISSVADKVFLYFDEPEKAYRAAEELQRDVMTVKIFPAHEKDAADSTNKEIFELLYAAANPFVLEFNKTP